MCTNHNLFKSPLEINNTWNGCCHISFDSRICNDHWLLSLIWEEPLRLPKGFIVNFYHDLIRRFSFRCRRFFCVVYEQPHSVTCFTNIAHKWNWISLSPKTRNAKSWTISTPLPRLTFLSEKHETFLSFFCFHFRYEHIFLRFSIRARDTKIFFS